MSRFWRLCDGISSSARLSDNFGPATFNGNASFVRRVYNPFLSYQTIPPRLC